MTSWHLEDAPDQTGRTALVTGANTGIGFETARMLAHKGANVVLACRDVAKADAAAERLRALPSRGTVSVLALDLTDLESVRRGAQAFTASQARLDLLIDNAGVMATPRGETKQGFELQLGTNHLGHFALTQQLLPLLEATPGSRIVVVSSLMHHFGQLDLDDLDWKRRGYDPQKAYQASKLANLLFVLELQRRLAAAGSHVLVVGAHPGVTRSELTRSMNGFVRAVNPFFATPTDNGALPTLRAATDPSVTGGSYWGPSGLFGLRGLPGPARISKLASDEALARRLFAKSEKLTGLAFPVASSATDGR